MDSFNAVVAKQEMNDDHETSIENATERFIVFFNRLDWFKSGTPCSFLFYLAYEKLSFLEHFYVNLSICIYQLHQQGKRSRQENMGKCNTQTDKCRGAIHNLLTTIKKSLFLTYFHLFEQIVNDPQTNNREVENTQTSG